MISHKRVTTVVELVKFLFNANPDDLVYIGDLAPVIIIEDGTVVITDEEPS